ncbi:hypothetical protein M2650_00215 [Luteimonas sp. SX5]|uniref:Uncharacterized protein n=1 Tax=Luteimonas galliterrae TaxID=2940486 RepID=A0ABT0MDX3_9GAMM|nr:hypothetical protein [Luteimonas galliterrae]MCL1633074.1 hypothetical protein [Luteimonas galliterrae]
MKITTRLMLIACLVLPFAACKKEEAPKEAVAAPVAVPTTGDRKAWQEYIKDVAKRNMDGVTSAPYAYFLPDASSPDFAGEYERQLEKMKGDVARGILEGNMLVFGSPSSAQMADAVIESFQGIQPGSMKGVKVVFVGAAADNERVKAAVTPAGVDYVFVQTK